MNVNEQLRHAFSLDPSINEVDVIDPLVMEFYSQQGTCDFLTDKLILTEHKLGISSDHLKEIIAANRATVHAFRRIYQPFNYTYQIINEDNQLRIINNSHQLEETEITIEQFQQYKEASRNILLVCGDNPTYMNVRKDLIDIERIYVNPSCNDAILTQELNFLALINLKYRKTAKSWHYRKELLYNIQALKKKTAASQESIRTIEQLDPQGTNLAVDVVVDELKFCKRVNVHQPRHYYMWIYRQDIIRLCSNIYDNELLKSLLQTERRDIQQLLKRVPNDASASFYLEWLNTW